MKRSVIRAMKSSYYIPTIILVLFLMYLAALFIFYKHRSERIRLNPQAELGAKLNKDLIKK